ncbi:MAG TPA: MlaD family protein [Thermoleophilaceae bacterium]|nr:MlaD family protein [Thermoleophilaceae bacterium]
MRSVSGFGRAAALAAVVAAGILVAVLLFGGGGAEYTVRATFLNASQLVNGNSVQVGGVRIGAVDGIAITDNGQAEVTLKVEDEFAPLPNGTRAVIRQASQSGIANRYVDLRIPGHELPAGTGDEAPVIEDAGTIADGGTIGVDETETAVDLDQLFNLLDPPTRRSLQKFLEGSAKVYAGRAREANRGYRYLSPSLSRSARLFRELNRDTPALEHFIVDSARLVTALADRRDDLAALIGNLNATTRAIGDEKVALASAIQQLPDFMRRSNSTFVNLRAALDDVEPLVDASKPVARKLGPFLDELRPFANDAAPTIRDLSAVVRRDGAGNDLIELTRTFTPLADIAVDTADRNGERRRGSLAENAIATRDTAPIIAFGVPYTPDLFGWFDDFSTTGAADAATGISRTQTYVNFFTPSTGGLGAPLIGPLLETRGEVFKQFTKIDQHKRCPGAAEAPAPDGSNVFNEDEREMLDCLEEDRATIPNG